MAVLEELLQVSVILQLTEKLTGHHAVLLMSSHTHTLKHYIFSAERGKSLNSRLKKWIGNDGYHSVLHIHNKSNCIELLTKYSIPLIDRVHFLLDAVSVDISIADQPASGVHHGFDLLLVGVHGGHEVLLLLNGSLCPLQSCGHLSMGQHVLLREREEGEREGGREGEGSRGVSECAIRHLIKNKQVTLVYCSLLVA